MKDIRPQIVHNLTMMEKLHKSKNDVWKAKAYSQARVRITGPIYNKDDVVAYKFGKSIHEKVLSIVETGKDLVDVTNMDSSVTILEELATIHAIGTVKAKELVETHHITSIEDLREKPHLLNDKQRVGLKYHDEISQKIPKTEMQKHDALLCKLLSEHFDNVLHSAVVGSYRREKDASGDIDLIVSVKECDAKGFIPKLLDIFKNSGYVPVDGVLAKGVKKVMGICTLGGSSVHRRIDVLLTNPSEYIFSVLYFTGNGEFNVKMREHAKKGGYTLNEKGLFVTATKERVANDFVTEKDIFTFLGIEFVEPKKREPESFRLTSSSDNMET